MLFFNLVKVEEQISLPSFLRPSASVWLSTCLRIILGFKTWSGHVSICSTSLRQTTTESNHSGHVYFQSETLICSATAWARTDHVSWQPRNETSSGSAHLLESESEIMCKIHLSCNHLIGPKSAALLWEEKHRVNRTWPAFGSVAYVYTKPSLPRALSSPSRTARFLDTATSLRLHVTNHNVSTNFLTWANSPHFLLCMHVVSISSF